MIISASLSALAAESSITEPLHRHYDNVLGTSLDITLYGPNQDRMPQAIEAALAEISRLEQILSTYREDSELMTLNRARSTDTASAELLEVVRFCEDWYIKTDSDFSCRLGQVMELWDAAEARQEFPLVPDMLPTARQANASKIVINPQQQLIELGEAISLEPSGLAKGYIIDRALMVLRRELPQSTAIKVDIGGDASYWGNPPDQNSWQVEVANPQAIADNEGFITTLSLNSMAVATSGHTTRTRKIRTREFSYILDSSRGWPINSGLYAVVIAPDTVTADAVATTLAAQNPGDALALVNSLPNIEALIIDSRGTQSISENWRNYLGEELLRQANASIEMTVNYTIPNLNERSYERPYIAIWIGDTEGTALKNLLLLGSEQRWAQSNSLWWRRTGRKHSLQTTNVTQPSRGPGQYQLGWDGRDDAGLALPPGDYLLHVEAAREHGGHNYLTLPFSLTEGSQTFESEGEGELGRVEVSLTMSLPE